MLKLFSQIKSNDEQLFYEVVKVCKTEPDSGLWFCTKTFSELKRVAEFCNVHSWDVDISRIQSKFTGFEFNLIGSLMKSNNAQALENRERMARTAAQRTTRFVEHWLKNREKLRHISELQSEVKRKAPTTDVKSQWDNLQSVFT